MEHLIERWTREPVFVPRPITDDIGPEEGDVAIRILAFSHKFRSPVGPKFSQNATSFDSLASKVYTKSILERESVFTGNDLMDPRLSITPLDKTLASTKG